MRERPILFSAPMVRAILEGRKTQTRRIVKHKGKLPPDWATFAQELSNINWNPALDRKNGLFRWACMEDEGVAPVRRWPYDGHGGYAIPCPYGRPGDRLWVKETWTGSWHPTRQSDMHILIAYAADGGEAFQNAPETYVLPKAAQKVGNWVTPLFMPRWASRILVQNTEIRVQRLQDITEEDAKAEGATPWEFGPEQCLTTGERGADSPYRSGFAYLWDCINADRATWKSNPWVWAVTFKEVQL